MPKIKLAEFGADKTILSSSSGPGVIDDKYVRNIHLDRYRDPSTVSETDLSSSGAVLLDSELSVSVGGTDLESAALPTELIVADGLMSAANGRLSMGNLGRSNLLITSDHIMPEQAVLSRMEGLRETSVYFTNGIGVRAAGGSDDNWITIPGASLRWYQPYATTVSLMHWDVFFSYNNWRGVYRDVTHSTNRKGYKTKIEFRCTLDGDYIGYSKRRLGENFFHPVSPGAFQNTDAIGPGLEKYGELELDEATGQPTGGNPKYLFPEAHSAVPFSLHHAAALSKGFHEINIQVKMYQIGGSAVYLQNIGDEKRTGPVKGRGYFELTAKVAMGIRNARVISFL